MSLSSAISLSPQTIRALRYNGDKDAYNSTITDPTDSSFNSKAIRDSISAKYQDKLDKNTSARERVVEQRDALNGLKSASSKLQSAIENLTSNNGTNIFTSYTAQGAPAGVSIQTSASAKAGSHTMQVASVATKQTIVIQAIDNAVTKNPMKFPKSTPAAPVIVTGGGPGQFTAGQSFSIYSGSYIDNANATLLDAVDIFAGDTLQDIADRINTNPVISAVLTAFVRTDNAGDELVLQSINPGTAGNFYINDLDITGWNHDGNTGAGGGGPNGSTAHATALGANLSITSDSSAIQSIDIYSANGEAFAAATAFIADNNENLSFQVGTWNIGAGFINVAVNPTSLEHLAAQINADIGAGITAQVVQIPNALPGPNPGYILRVSAKAGNPLNYQPAALSAILFGGIQPTAMQARPKCAVDGQVIIDGVTYNMGGSSTLTSPTSDIESLTVSAPTANTTFSITQDVSSLVTQIDNLVTAINTGQQFIAQQKDEEAPLRSSNEVRSLANMINQVTSGASGAASFTSMGITWVDYQPTATETRNGLVPARYLQIDETALTNYIIANFNDVKGLFLGTLTATTSPAGAKASLLSLNNVQLVSQFDLQVTNNGAVDPQTGNPTYDVVALNYGGGAPQTMKYTYITATTGLISGLSGTPFAGLSINYTLPSAPVLGNGDSDTVAGIKVYNGIALPFKVSLDKFLDSANGGITSAQNKVRGDIERLVEKRKKTLVDRNKKLQKIDIRTRKLRAKEALMKALQKARDRERNVG